MPKIVQDGLRNSKDNYNSMVGNNPFKLSVDSQKLKGCDGFNVTNTTKI